ncbi:unnamed protein product [Rhizophagus irregularis]|uniref:Uncharacterized protein n=1 Tax=Rhizophagus irregularis TaxID=588596 RepID=A0A915Z653_9GLOM|nr:unnamed protein product [Rhizophagus irregularis]CAB5362106.1 unnamed protein product [Rhizophagus irregularis]
MQPKSIYNKILININSLIESLQIDISQLKFNNNNFPETDDYHEKSDNTINTESLESLQIDISQLNISEDGK